jgi:hypothetical protein
MKLSFTTEVEIRLHHTNKTRGNLSPVDLKEMLKGIFWREENDTA